MRFGIIAAAVVASSTSFALPHPDNPRAGANHRLGDDSFHATYGRAPSRRIDTEQDRMRTHLEYVRAYLAGRLATKPELAARRAELLGYLDAYIAKGITPRNEQLPWATPVFIDDHGAICAVGYLIERSAGRALPEKIAAAHRYEFLETIAEAMPEVRAWIEGSGFTLEELASIQPAYSEADAETWRPWDLAKDPPADGAYEEQLGMFHHVDDTTQPKAIGTFKRRHMEGAWKAVAADTVIGTGTFKRGSGTWTSFYTDGKAKLAEGRYVNDRANGAWTFFHKSGNVAAQGTFANGYRAGAWRFYYDTPKRTPIATGRFTNRGIVAGTWKHFDAEGTLIAKTWRETPTHWRAIDNGTVDGGDGHVLEITPGTDGVRHVIHQGNVQLQKGDIQSYIHKLELLERGGERVYIYASGFAGHVQEGGDHPAPDPLMFDPDGNRLLRGDAGWTAASCRWSAKRKGIAKSGDIARLHNVLYQASRERLVKTEQRGDESYRYTDTTIVDAPEPACGTATQLSAARSARLDTLLATRDAVRAPTAAFVRDLVLEHVNVEPDRDDEYATAARTQAADLKRVLSAHMVTYLQWPHVDKRFIQVFDTLPGRRNCYWHSPCDAK